MKSLGILRFLFFGLLFFTTTNPYIAYYAYLPKDFMCESAGAWYLLSHSFSEVSTLILIYKIALVFSAVGFLSIISFWISFLSFFVIVMNSIKFCFFNHNYYAIPIALFLWALLDNSSDYRLDRLWQKKKLLVEPLPLILFLRIHFCIIFFLSGYTKLRNSGIEWIFSNTLQNVIALQRFNYDSFPQAKWFHVLNIWITSFPSYVIYALALFVVLAEISAPLALFSKRLRYPILLSLLSLQVGIYFFMYLNFVAWLPLYLCWLVKDSHSMVVRNR